MNSDSADEACKAGIYNGVHFGPSNLARRWRVAAWIEKNATIAARLIRAQSSRGKLAVEPGALTAAFEERLGHLVRYCREHGSIVVLLTTSARVRRTQSRFARTRAVVTSVFFMPYMSIGGLIAAWDAYDDAIRRVAKDSGAVLIEIAKGVPGDREHFIDSTHFSDAGIRRMADWVFRGLTESSVFRALIADRSGTA